jgi:hypothetical protein
MISASAIAGANSIVSIAPDTRILLLHQLIMFRIPEGRLRPID